MFRKITALLLTVIMFTAFAGVVSPAFAAGGKNENQEEFRGVWVAYPDFVDSKEFTRAEFTDYAEEICSNVAEMGMNAIMMHVRPFSDAMYKSAYYPWSYYASGEQGVNPGYDPLAIMVEKAHAYGLEIHAWLNPYRISTSWNYGTDVMKLSKKNPARKWLTNSKTSDDRNVLEYGGAMYYNPSKSAVRKLIVNGVKEIVANYDVDGIHFDDYFYPDLGNNYETNFDAEEYQEYAAKRAASGKKAVSIARWRMNNVNTLVREVYAAVKETDPDVIFGISPGGYIDYFDEEHRWYVDYRTWMSEEGYIDYICPQLYWSFNSRNRFPFYDTLLQWIGARKLDSVKVYAGIPVYKLNEEVKITSGSTMVDTEFFNQFLLAEYVGYSRRSGGCDGYIFYDYSDLVKEKNRRAVEYLKEIW